MCRPKASARRLGFRILGASVLAFVCGCVCSSVHFVSQTPGGGVLVIPNNSDQWPTYYRSRAEQLLKKTCPDGYVIDREEVVTEGPTRSGKQAANDNEDFDYSGALVRISHHQRQVYQITFHCSPPPAPRESAKASQGGQSADRTIAEKDRR